MNLETLTFLTTGFLLGLQHSVDTDHVIAVSTMVSESRNLKKSAILGAFWGMGHTTTLLITGFFILILKLTLLIKFSNLFESLVGLVLIYLGVSLGVKVRKEQLHVHSHEHDGRKHIHLHSHKESKAHNHNHKAYLTGLAHGLAGTASLMLIILSAASSTLVGLIFILLFGFGSMLGMSVIAFLVNIPFSLSEKKFLLLNKGLKFIVASISIVFGLLLLNSTFAKLI